jgi:hypothetical protein
LESGHYFREKGAKAEKVIRLPEERHLLAAASGPGQQDTVLRKAFLPTLARQTNDLIHASDPNSRSNTSSSEPSESKRFREIIR